jgi:hypothetical protein
MLNRYLVGCERDAVEGGSFMSGYFMRLENEIKAKSSPATIICGIGLMAGGPWRHRQSLRSAARACVHALCLAHYHVGADALEGAMIRAVAKALNKQC